MPSQFFRKLPPVEILPIFAMVGVACGYGIYIAHGKLTKDVQVNVLPTKRKSHYTNIQDWYKRI